MQGVKREGGREGGEGVTEILTEFSFVSRAMGLFQARTDDTRL